MIHERLLMVSWIMTSKVTVVEYRRPYKFYEITADAYKQWNLCAWKTEEVVSVVWEVSILKYNQ